MKIILLKDVPGIGRKNDIKEISDGYARNYLLPKKLAEQATEKTVKDAIKAQKIQAEKTAKEAAILKEITTRLGALEIKLPIKVNSEGVIFGSVNTHAITDKLKESGFDIKKEQIKLMSPIKTIGKHAVTILLKQGIEVKINVDIIKE